MTVEHFGLVPVPRAGGAVGVQDQRPALPVDHDLVVVAAKQNTISEIGLAAVGLVPDVVHLAGRRGLVAPAGPPAVLVPEPDRAADPGRDVLGVAHIQRQAQPAEPGAELAAAQEARQPAGPRQQVHGLADDRLLESLAGPLGQRHRPGPGLTVAWTGLVVAGINARP